MQKLLILLVFLCALTPIGYAQSTPPFRIERIDGTLGVLSPTRIKITSSQLTCAGKVCTISVGSGSGTVTNSNTLTSGKAIIGDGTTVVKASKVTITDPATTATLTIADNKTATFSNTLTLAGTDGSTLNVGTGGTLGTAAFTASTAYANTALSNLASVSINTTLVPQTGVSLGAAATAFQSLYIYGSGTYGSHSLRITGSPTGNRIIGLPDFNATLATLAGTETFTNKTLTSPTITGGAANPLTLQVNSGATITKILTGTGSLNFGATAAGACDILTVTVTGAADGDNVILGIPDALANADNYQTFRGWVSAADTVSISRCNLLNAVTALSNPAAATVRATVIQF